MERERWTTPLSKASDLAGSYNPQNIQQISNQAVGYFLGEVEAAIAKAAETGEKQDAPEASQLAQAITNLVLSNGGVWADYQEKLAKAKAYESVEPYLRHLTRDERKKLRDAGAKTLLEFHKEFYPIVADALLRAAPEEVVKKRVAQAEKDLGLAEKLEKLQQALGKNGRKARTETQPTTTYSTKMEARTLHVQGKLTNAQMRAINADPTIPEQ